MCSCKVIIKLEEGMVIQIDPRDFQDFQSEPKKETPCLTLETCAS